MAPRSCSRAGIPIGTCSRHADLGHERRRQRPAPGVRSHLRVTRWVSRRLHRGVPRDLSELVTGWHPDRLRARRKPARFRNLGHERGRERCPHLRRVSDPRFSSLAWSPDGTEFAYSYDYVCCSVHIVFEHLAGNPGPGLDALIGPVNDADSITFDTARPGPPTALRLRSRGRDGVQRAGWHLGRHRRRRKGIRGATQRRRRQSIVLARRTPHRVRAVARSGP